MGQVRPRSHSHPVSQKVGRFGKVSQYSLALSPPKHVGGGGGGGLNLPALTSLYKYLQVSRQYQLLTSPDGCVRRGREKPRT